MFKMCKKCMCNNFVQINSLKTLFNWKYGRYAINLSNILRYACICNDKVSENVHYNLSALWKIFIYHKHCSATFLDKCEKTRKSLP